MKRVSSAHSPYAQSPIDETVGQMERSLWNSVYSKREDGDARGPTAVPHRISRSSASVCRCGNSISGITAAARLIVGRFATWSRKNELLTKEERDATDTPAMESRYPE